jgi:hypothetical protein
MRQRQYERAVTRAGDVSVFMCWSGAAAFTVRLAIEGSLSIGSLPSTVARRRQVRNWLQIITAILGTPVIEHILTDLGLQARARAPPRAAALGQALHAA